MTTGSAFRQSPSPLVHALTSFLVPLVRFGGTIWLMVVAFRLARADR